MIELFKQWIVYLAVAVETMAGLVIAFAAIEAGVNSFRLFVHRREMQLNKEQIRLGLGRWLALGLEFELAAILCQGTEE